MHEPGISEDPSQPDQHQTRYEQPCAHRHHCGPRPEVLNRIHRFFITHGRSDSSLRLKSSVMVAEYYVESENMTSSPSDRGPWPARAKRLLTHAPSIWALTVTSTAVTLVAAGPMRVCDYRLSRRWLYLADPDLVWFAQHILDPIAGQAVCLPVLAITAITLSYRRRSWRPIVFAA